MNKIKKYNRHKKAQYIFFCLGWLILVFDCFSNNAKVNYSFVDGFFAGIFFFISYNNSRHLEIKDRISLKVYLFQSILILFLLIYGHLRNETFSYS